MRESKTPIETTYYLDYDFVLQRMRHSVPSEIDAMITKKLPDE